MWYEILPSLAVIGVCINMPDILIYFTNKVFLGNPYKRYICTQSDKHLFLRDMRLSGINFAYKQIGLESLPDDDTEEIKGSTRG